jgi:aryl-alcohol dehydrogenase-like predicted oxidoreductase
MTAALGERPEVAALAVALAQPWADVVLSGAATPAQLRSNLEALEFMTEPDPPRLATLAVDPVVYWDRRAAMPWT